MTQVSRRSFLAASAAAATASTLLDSARAAEDIAGFDQTSTDYDRTAEWRPFSDRKVRVGIVGHGGSHGYLGDDFIDAILRGRKPAVDVFDALNMTVPGYYAHLSAMKDGETFKIPQYSL